MKAIGSLGKKTLIYALASSISRSISFFLVPVFVVYLGAEEYGIWGITVMCQTLVVMVFASASGITIIKFYHQIGEENIRDQFLGGFWLLLVCVMVLFVVFFEIAGDDLLDLIFRQVPYHPYGRFVIWTSAVSIVSSGFLLNLFKARQRAGLFALLTATSASLQILFALYLVILCHQGITGALKSKLWEALIVFFPSLLVLWKNVRLSFPSRQVARAVRFGLPLMPELIGFWALSMFDRIILSNYVSLSEVGIYTLGYQFGMVVNLIVNAIDNTWLPYFLSTIKEGDHEKQSHLARMVTLLIGSLLLFGLCLTLTADPVVRLLGNPEFHRASSVAPWIIASYIILGFTLLPRGVLILSARTGRMALATGVGALMNVALNLLFIPKWGIMAASVNTFVCYGTVLLIMQWLARGHGIRFYEKSELFKLPLFCAIIYIIGSSISVSSTVATVGLRLLIFSLGASVWLISMAPRERTLLLVSKILRSSR